jgi:hypothetical protein
LAFLKSDQDAGITYAKQADPAEANRLYLFADVTMSRGRTAPTRGALHDRHSHSAQRWTNPLEERQRQPIAAQSSCESEFIAACKGANEVSYLHQLLGEMGYPQAEPTRVYGDNKAAKDLAHNPGMLKDRSKHFQLRWKKLQEYVRDRTITTAKTPAACQVADILTKDLAPGLFTRTVRGEWISQAEQLPTTRDIALPQDRRRRRQRTTLQAGPSRSTASTSTGVQQNATRGHYPGAWCRCGSHAPGEQGKPRSRLAQGGNGQHTAAPVP